MPKGDEVRLLDGGRVAYPAMLAAIEGARGEISLEVYAFSPEGIGARFMDALSAAARRGVTVEVVIDGWGSAPSAREVAEALSGAGCHVVIFGRLLGFLAGRFRRNHRKILAVDGRVAFLGGINIGDEYGAPDAPPDAAPWADLAIEIRGPTAEWLQGRFRRRRGLSPAGPVRVWLSGVGGGRALRRRYLLAFRGAGRTLCLAHGYFLPDRRLVRAIAAAARRGVEVKLVLAGRSDVALSRPATRRLHRRLLRAGVGISEWTRSVLHAKAATVDGERLLVGSFNLDPFSLANLEALAEVQVPAAAEEVERWIRARFDEGELVTLERIGAGGGLVRVFDEWIGPLVARAAQRIARWFARR